MNTLLQSIRKIVRRLAPETRQPVLSFASQHRLTLEVSSQLVLVRGVQSRRYFARFRGAEIKQHANSKILRSERGEGFTPAQAIGDYAFRISGQFLVLHADSSRRREFHVPQLLCK